MIKTLRYSFCIALTVFLLSGGSAFALTITALGESDLLNLMPTDVIGQSYDPLRIADGTQGVDGVPFFLDANEDIDDDDDPIVPGQEFSIYLGPATENDSQNFPEIDIDALLMTVTFDVSSGLSLLPVTLSESSNGSDTLDTSDSHWRTLSFWGFESGGGGMSFNPVDEDLAGAFLITDADPEAFFNQGTHTDIGDFILSVPGFTDDYLGAYRIDLFGVDEDYEYTSPPGGSEIVSAGPNSSGGFLVPEPGSLAIIGSLLMGMAWKKRRVSTRS